MKNLNLGQLKLLPTDKVDELYILFEQIVSANNAYHKRPSVRAGRELRKVLLSIQKAATSARAEILQRRKLKAASATMVKPESELVTDPAQISLPL